MHHDDLRHAGDEANGDEVALQLVVELGVHGRRNGMVHRAHEESVAIGRRLGRDARAQRATGATLVVDDELMPRLAREHGRQGARKGVKSHPGREGTTQVTGLLGQAGLWA